MKKKKIFLIVTFVLLMISAFLLFPFADNTEPKQDVKNLYLNQFQIDGETDIYYDNQEVLEVQFAGETIWRAGSEVTFNLDSGNSQMIYYDYAKSVFEKAPAPQKEGWEFIGWSFSDEATPDKIVTTYAADSTDFNMYAVFRKLITVTFYNNSDTPTVLSDYAYYNNGNIDNPEFDLQPLQRNGWTLQGISESTNKTNVSTVYNDITLEQNTTYYSIYTKQLNLTYNASNGTNNSITKNYEVLYCSTGYDYNGIKLCTANDVGFKDSLGNVVCVWQEASTGNTYDLGINCPSEFCTSNTSNYTFNALYGSIVTYITKVGTFPNGSNTMEKVVIYGNDIGVLNADEQPTASGYVYDGVTWSGNTDVISNFKADGKPYTVYVRLKQYHHHTTSGNIHVNDNASSSGGLSNNYSAPSSGGCFTTANYHKHSSGGGSITAGTHLADNAVYSSAGGCYQGGSSRTCGAYMGCLFAGGSWNDGNHQVRQEIYACPVCGYIWNTVRPIESFNSANPWAGAVSWKEDAGENPLTGQGYPDAELKALVFFSGSASSMQAYSAAKSYLNANYGTRGSKELQPLSIAGKTWYILTVNANMAGWNPHVPDIYDTIKHFYFNNAIQGMNGEYNGFNWIPVGTISSSYVCNNTVTAYARSCGKSTSTIEYYSRSCGLTEGQVMYTYSWK